VKSTHARLLAVVTFLCVLAGLFEIFQLDKSDKPAPRRAEETEPEPTQLPPSLPEVVEPEPATATYPNPPAVLTQRKVVVPSAAPAAVPALITLKSIQFKGVTLLGEMELKGLTERFIRVPMSYERMLDIGAAVESYYRKNNYLARVILPPQDLSQGILQVEVIESTLSQADVDKKLSSTPQSQSSTLHAPPLDRSLALLHDMPHMQSQSAQVNETELLLKLYQNRSRQAELVMDNGGTQATGMLRTLINVSWFSPTAVADFLNVVAVHSQGSDYARLAYSLPVGQDGWRFGVGVAAMSYDVLRGESSLIGTVGRAIAKGLDLTYPLLRNPDAKATLTLAAENKNFQNTSNQAVSKSDSSTQVLSAQVSGFYRELNPNGGSGAYTVQLAQGQMSGVLNQPTDGSSPLKTGNFQKLRVGASWQQPLTSRTSVYAAYAGQTADKTLESTEKMQLGGIHGVRAYAAGQGLGSKAQLVQLELRQQLGSGVRVAGFYDWGQLRDENRSSIYKGFGASIGYTNDDGVNFRVTWARRQGQPVNPQQNGTDLDTSRDRNRYWFQATLPF
jgi:hemolysin activation/secretion protein